MSISISKLIQKRANELKNKVALLNIEEIEGHQDLIPEINDDNVLELTNLFLFLFPSADTKTHLIELLEYKDMDLSDESIEKLTPLLHGFIVFLKKVAKHIQ